MGSGKIAKAPPPEEAQLIEIYSYRPVSIATQFTQRRCTHGGCSCEVRIPCLIGDLGIIDREFLFACLAEYMAGSAVGGNDHTARRGQKVKCQARLSTALHFQW